MSAHRDFCNKIMLWLQKTYKDKILLRKKVVGVVYFKPAGKFTGPYRIGNKGESDIYGYLLYMTCWNCPFFIEAKIGRGRLTPSQRIMQKRAKELVIPFFVARDTKFEEFKEEFLEEFPVQSHRGED